MKNLMIAVALTVMCCVANAAAVEPAWMTNYEDASALSRRIGHPLLLVFVSSDHSAPSMRMDNEVFNTQEFRQYAQKHFVLVRIDFLQDSSKQNPALIDQNYQLQQKYDVENLPTCIVLDSKERVSKTIVGYTHGGPGPFIDSLVPVEHD